MRHGYSWPPAAEATELSISGEKSTFLEAARDDPPPELGERLGISSAQIRKDLSQFGEFGKQGTGYNIGYLSDQLKGILKVLGLWRSGL